MKHINAYPRMGAYTFQDLYFEDPAFRHIEVSFVITMENAHERRKLLMKELRKHRPTRVVRLLFNPGYLQGRKEPWVKRPYDDLWHANRHIFRQVFLSEHPILQGDMFMVLEDDVVFTDDFRKHAGDVESFMLSNSKVHAYNLGCIPLSVAKEDRPSGRRQHIKLKEAGCAHALVYRRSSIVTLLSMCNGNEDFSVGMHDLAVHGALTTYTHVSPLAVQTFDVDTENMDHWPPFAVVGMKVFKRAAAWGNSNIFQAAHESMRVGGIKGMCTLAMYVSVAVAAVCISVTLSYPLGRCRRSQSTVYKK